MRYALLVAYDGTNFCGWQVQPNGRTVQGELENAIYACFNQKARVCGSGRTDGGVHAAAQVAHVDLDVVMPPHKLADALNARLNGDLSVLASAAAPDGFDANRAAKRKTYRYSFYVSPRKNPLKERYAFRLDKQPPLDKMRECAALFEGEHDFKSYCASGSAVKTTVREIYSFTVEQEGGYINLYVCGNGFLYNMVRTLAGTALWYALGKIDGQTVLKTLSGDCRGEVGKTLPAKGLTLFSVEYADKIFE